ncbi:MAG TPA: malate synthase A [Flavobacteriales bacterium]|nr:malate synthase A [Flavobacteriales bacterium]HIN40574.1 malate synthase A [Flavobacteriales bacterium]
MTTETLETTSSVDIAGEMPVNYKEILTPDAISFIAKLHLLFNQRRQELVALRQERQAEIDKGVMPNFLPETERIREDDWFINAVPSDLLDRRVEITGPVERKTLINALNSGAKVFMADFEDSNAPTWSNVMDGQVNLRDAVNKTITYHNEITNKHYQLNKEVATLMVRPRGWHLTEKNFLVHGEEVSASLFDFGLYFYHNAFNLIKNGTGPYFYLPKLENHLEARLWNDIFLFSQEELGLPSGTIKATVLIETILASFELNEILWELKEHSAGLNCGRWDYIFSFIKRFRNRPGFLLPDRSQITMTVDFMRAYSLLVIKTCHKRGAHAMGGMAAQIPVKNDPKANELALNKVRADKVREAKDGHDGTWVAHPGLVNIAKDVFDEYMPKANQIGVQRDDVLIEPKDLIRFSKGEITEEGLKLNIDVAIQYIESWLNGNGCVPIYNLMEDAATAEISRAQVWQWLNNPDARLSDGRDITIELYRALVPKQLKKIKSIVGNERYENGKFELAAQLFDELVTNKEFEEFLTIPAYKYLN